MGSLLNVQAEQACEVVGTGQLLLKRFVSGVQLAPGQEFDLISVTVSDKDLIKN